MNVDHDDRGGRSEDSLQERALRLSACLSKSFQSYTSLLEIEREQSRLIAEEDLDGVAEKIGAKNALIEEIGENDRALHAQNEAWQPLRESAPEALRNRLQDQVGQLQAVMTELIEAQRKNEEELQSRGKEISAKLIELQKKKTAHKGYQSRLAGDAYRQSKFYDKNS